LLCVDVKEFLNAVVGRATEKKKLTQKASEHDAPNFAKTYSKKFSEFNFKENGYVLFFIIDNFLFFDLIKLFFFVLFQGLMDQRRTFSLRKMQVFEKQDIKPGRILKII
jgi:hypothetical protein